MLLPLFLATNVLLGIVILLAEIRRAGIPLRSLSIGEIVLIAFLALTFVVPVFFLIAFLLPRTRKDNHASR